MKSCVRFSLIGLPLFLFIYWNSWLLAQESKDVVVPSPEESHWDGSFIHDILREKNQIQQPVEDFKVAIDDIEKFAECGRTLLVEAGLRRTPLQIDLSCNAQKPLIIRSTVQHDAVFEFENSAPLVVNGNFIIIDGFKFQGQGIVLNGSNNQLIRNQLVDSESIAIQLRVSGSNKQTAYNIVGQNEISGFQQQGIEINVSGDSLTMQYNWIYGNYLHDTDTEKTGNGREAIRVLTDAYRPTYTLIEANILENVWVPKEPEAISVKTAGVYVVGNQLNSARSQIVMRESQGSSVYGNRLIQGDIRVNGRNHVVARNQLNSGDIKIPSGDQTFAAPVCLHKPVPCAADGSSAHAAAESILVVDNVLLEGSIDVGECIGFSCPAQKRDWSEAGIYIPTGLVFKENNTAPQYKGGAAQ